MEFIIRHNRKYKFVKKVKVLEWQNPDYICKKMGFEPRPLVDGYLIFEYEKVGRELTKDELYALFIRNVKESKIEDVLATASGKRNNNKWLLKEAQVS